MKNYHYTIGTKQKNIELTESWIIQQEELITISKLYKGRLD